MSKIKRTELLALCEAAMDSKIGLNREAVYRGEDDIAYRACALYEEFGGKNQAYIDMAKKMKAAKEKEYVEVEDEYTIDFEQPDAWDKFVDFGAIPNVDVVTSPAVVSFAAADREADDSGLPKVDPKKVCPKCGKSHFSIDGGMSTCAYYPPYIVEDGAVKKNPDRNIRTTSYTCLECGHSWEE